MLPPAGGLGKGGPRLLAPSPSGGAERVPLRQGDKGAGMGHRQAWNDGGGWIILVWGGPVLPPWWPLGLGAGKSHK